MLRATGSGGFVLVWLPHRVLCHAHTSSGLALQCAWALLSYAGRFANSTYTMRSFLAQHGHLGVFLYNIDCLDYTHI